MKRRFPVNVFAAAIISILLSVFSVGILWYEQKRIPYVFLFVGLALIAFVLGNILLFRKNVNRYIITLRDDISRSELETLYIFPEPVTVLDKDGFIIWYNSAFTENIVKGSEVYGEKLTDICSVNLNELEYHETTTFIAGERVFSIKKMTTSETKNSLTMLCFNEITEHYNLCEKYKKTRPVVMVIVIDNYEDLIQNAKEVEKAQVSVAIDRVVSDYIADTGSISKRTDRDRYIVITEQQYLDKIIEDKFSVLEKAHTITMGERVFITLSIGVGMDSESFEEAENFAKESLDMALGRGGDQVAIKIDGGFKFFGGTSQTTEKKSRSKARTITNALMKLLENCSEVLIMGHRNSDLDSIGAAVGLAGAVKLNEKKVNVVVERKTTLANNLIEDVLKNPDFKDIFVDIPTALEIINQKTLLIIVDVHNKDILESRDLYDRAKTVVVIDHHRKVVNFIDKAVIFHLESFSSSASEMVTEIIQYMDNASRLPTCCADALLAGITLDTKNFVMRTGSRTFEAAAYLRKIGADTVAVKRLFASTIESYKRKMSFISNAEIHGSFAIADLNDSFEDIRTVAPQVADELLSVDGVEAAFSIYKQQDMVSISARSLGTTNVQLIMEQLGGGGHQNMAAAQLKNISVRDAKELLIKTLDAL